jgi:cation-dependent mannose-6-phosphate receptor
MIYLVLGTLYNRFVLGLTGFDQVPQFSFDSALYHAQNAWESLKDYVHGSKYHYPVPESSPGLGGVASRGVRSGLDGARRVFGRATGGGGGGQGQVNSFSHQAQVQTQNQSPAQSRSGEYERPAGGVSATPTGTNPVSHQSQVMSAPVSV